MIDNFLMYLQSDVSYPSELCLSLTFVDTNFQIFCDSFTYMRIKVYLTHSLHHNQQTTYKF